MNTINLESDISSILTNISANESADSSPRSICLHSDNRFIGFQRNDDPNIVAYMETRPEKTGWEKYKSQCWQFGIPPIRMFGDCLNGESNLNLAYYIPKSIGAVYGFEILTEQPNISVARIDMEDCPMTETGCLSLNEFLRRRCPIEYLNLKNTKIGHKGLGILEQGLYVNQGIQHINLSGSKIGDEGALILARALNGNQTCEHLDISHNNLRSSCAVGEILSNSCIKVLNLSWNQLCLDECVAKIFQGVKNSNYIKELDYSWNGLSGGDWIKSFKQALLKNVSLELLRIDNNRLSANADEIMSSISKSSSLRELHLGGNPWKEQDWKNILNVYLKQSNLITLELGVHTYLTENCVISIKTIATVNPQLKIVYKGQIKDQKLEEVNFKNILIDRMKTLALQPKKKKLRRNMGHFFLKLKEANVVYDDPENFSKRVAEFGAKLDAPLIQQFIDEFSFDELVDNKKVRQLDLLSISDYYLARHPTEPPKPDKENTKKNRKRDKKKDEMQTKKKDEKQTKNKDEKREEKV